MEEEIWKNIEDYIGYYQVSTLSRIRSVDREVVQLNCFGKMVKRILKGKIIKKNNSQGYNRVCLAMNNKNKHFRVCRIVAQSFVLNPENKPHVNHINGIKNCDLPFNLEWVTPKENTDHAIKTGLMDVSNFGKDRIGALSQISKLTIDLQTGVFYESGAQAEKARGFHRGMLSDPKIKNKRGLMFC